ncbi:MAG: hypothetical protein FLDDKLPJ_00592 [Phycisphaerae bacterium]|nr:hypothetical protein [Phycisphaerae bacterium]
MKKPERQPEPDFTDPEFLISRVLDDDATPHERRELEARMQSDSDLHREHESYRKLDDLLDRWAADEPRVDWTKFHATVMAEARGRAGAARRQRLMFRIAGPVAAAAAVLLLVWPGTRVPSGPGGSGRAYLHVQIRAPVAPVALMTADAAPAIHVAFARDRKVELPPPAPPKMMIGLVERADSGGGVEIEEALGTF